jgi:hypothetical protein
VAPKIGDVTQPIEDAVQRQIRVHTDTTVKSPFEQAGERVVTSQEKLTAAIEQLTSVIGHGTGISVGGGGTPSPGEIAGLRADAAARFWNSRRGKQLAQETASA